MKRGLLLINLGTPNSTDTSSVRSYLREFLTDKRVIDLSPLLRYILVYLFILPFRSKRSAQAYQSIWTEQGSPLLLYSQNLVNEVQKEVGSEYIIALGMRYGNPSITTALNQLKQCESITILPLYPQYSSAANGSSIAEAMRVLGSWDLFPSIKIISDFFQHPAYLKAQAQTIKTYLREQTHVLFSYHGIPERQITKSSCKSICTEACPTLTDSIQKCYRAQCHQSSRLLACELGLSTNSYSTAFQSRLGKTPWIKPYTDHILAELIAKGIKKLVIVCPSFVADCLETLEEIGIRLKKQWLTIGGEELIIVPSMNSEPLWIKAIITIAQMQSDSQFRSIS
ncbi:MULTISPECIES: ferrochelatase [Legionella]|uniref:Ferrochelatase n=1 Tax=Legionella resiliens TaxID=2905958 RepID=A0ABS8X951_9GAMM|nr:MULTISPECIES: ferrochelatase [unclassified Legionella]MCE0724797.1 ferrochelatase [Legionella sp. 9fVS26]MCE3533951.1 ferrochelatase [Legionella sp. 8cVS16]QLZ70186.1 ferrochelatase [Legionella sp. PC1000]